MEKISTILMIDDDEDDIKLFFEAIKEVDDTIKCVSAANGKEALLYLENQSNPVPAFIFLDLRMPGLTGKKCLEEIRKNARMADTPVIVYTTSREVNESIELKKMGATHFMSKPVSPDEIYYMVSFVLGEKWN